MTHGRRPVRRHVALAGVSLAAVLVVALLVAALVLDRSRRDQASRPGGRVWHVAADASGRGTGEPGRPFSRVQSAIEAAQAGDTILVGPGSYRGGLRSVRSGHPDRRIHLVGHGARIGGDATYLIEITHDHLDVIGFELSGGKSAIRLYGARGVRLLDNTIRNTGGECIRIKYGSVRNEVGHNRISGCGRQNFDPEASKNGEGVYVGTAPEQLHRNPGGDPDRSVHNWIHDNRIDAPAECVDVKEGSDHTLIERNDCTGGRDPDGAGFSIRANHGTLRANTVHGGSGAGIRIGGDTDKQGVDTTVVGNVVVDADGYGLKLMRAPQATVCGNDLRAERGETNEDDAEPGRPCG
ncbi:MAG TPA: right-handed parallel beta-helix repeat-containing protein [Pilimelia sp.]|nr:right-handed parallel beta-helix repeat-containing protein [Pilimelia sp.]